MIQYVYIIILTPTFDHQVHGDGCFHSGPIPLSLTGKYADTMIKIMITMMKEQVVLRSNSLALLASVLIWKAGKKLLSEVDVDVDVSCVYMESR